MLDSPPALKERIEEVGDVSGRVDVRDVRLEPLVDDDAVLERDAAVLEEVGDRRDADADDGEVGFDAATVLRGHRFEGPVAVKRFDLVPEHAVDTLRDVQSRELVAQLLDPQLVEEPAAEVEHARPPCRSGAVRRSPPCR